MFLAVFDTIMKQKICSKRISDDRKDNEFSDTLCIDSGITNILTINKVQKKHPMSKPGYLEYCDVT